MWQICTPDMKLHSSHYRPTREKKKNLMWRHDNDLLQPSGADCYYHPEDKGVVYICAAGWECTKEEEEEKAKKTIQTEILQGESHVCLLCSWACTVPACLCRGAQMGVWGDGCCQLTDQAVGRWSHCYSPHKHVGHVRHVPWRHTRGDIVFSVCVCVLFYGPFCSVNRGTREEVWEHRIHILLICNLQLQIVSHYYAFFYFFTSHQRRLYRIDKSVLMLHIWAKTTNCITCTHTPALHNYTSTCNWL